MYYLTNREIIMAHVTKYLDVPLMERGIRELIDKKNETIKTTATLRVADTHAAR